MKKYLIAAFLCIPILNYAQPVADFTAVVDDGCVPDSVFFNNLSTGASSFKWDFDDFGATSTAITPFHEYTFNTGTRFVTLTAYDGLGDSSVIVKPVFLKGAPNANGSISPLGGTCLGELTTFGVFGTSAPPRVHWDFGDGDTSNLYRTTHTYSDTGVYTVHLVVYTSCGNDTDINLVTVSDDKLPSMSIQADSVVCPTEYVDLNSFGFGGNDLTYHWDFGDGDTSTESDPVHQYMAAGNVTVIMQASNACGTIADTHNILVTSGLTPNASAFIMPSTGCPGDSIGFNAFGSNPAIWQFGDGGISNLTDPTYAYSAPGTYTVIYTETNACGNSDSDTETVTITNSLIPSIMLNVLPSFGSICPGRTVSFSVTGGPFQSVNWDFGDGNTSTLQNPTHVYTALGSYTVNVAVTNNCGNNTQASTTVDVVSSGGSLSASISSTPINGVVCTGSDVLLRATGFGIKSYSWDLGDGDTSNLANVTHSYSAPGTYEVTLRAVDFCGNVAYDGHTIVVTNSNRPQATIGMLAPDCSGDSVRFLAGIYASGRHHWDFGDGDTSSLEDPKHLYAGGGTYTVTMIVYSMCGNDTATRTVVLRDGPMADYSVAPAPAGAPSSFTDLSTGSPTKWEWDFGDGDTSLSQNPSHTFQVAGTYPVNLRVSRDGCMDNKATQVNIWNVSIGQISVEPLSISPNPAGDLVYFQTDETSFTVSILNSIGQEVLTSANKRLVDVSVLKSGWYIVILTSESGEWRGKLVK